MNRINPSAIVFIAFTTVVGFLLGSTAGGAAVGLGVVVLADMLT